MLRGDFDLAIEVNEKKTHLVIADVKTVLLCGVSLETFSDVFGWIGQVRCHTCRLEYAKLLRIKGDLE